MKVEVSVNAEGFDFPRLMISEEKDTIVLFKSYTNGTCMMSDNNRFIVGNYYDDLAIRDFEDFEGELIIRNNKLWPLKMNTPNENSLTINFEAVKTKSKFNIMGILSLVKIAGGEMAMIEQINESYKIGEITKKQAFDLRKYIKEVCKLDITL